MKEGNEIKLADKGQIRR